MITTASSLRSAAMSRSRASTSISNRDGLDSPSVPRTTNTRPSNSTPPSSNVAVIWPSGGIWTLPLRQRALARRDSYHSPVMVQR